MEELRLSALERRIDADLEAGRNSELIGELEALIADHPLREHLRWQLIFYRADRQAEALEVYRETRRLLTEELGLELSPALRDLEKAILRQDAALAITAAPRPSGEALKEPPQQSARRWLVPTTIGVFAIASGAAIAFALVRSNDPPSAAGTQTVLVVTQTTHTPPPPTATRAAHPTQRTPHNRPITATAPPSTPTTIKSQRPSTQTKVARPPHRVTHAPVKQQSTPKAPPRPDRAQTPTTPTSSGHSTTPTSTMPAPRTPPPPATAATITDTFDTEYLDGTVWYEICCAGTGATLAERAGELEFAFAPDTTPGGPFATAGPGTSGPDANSQVTSTPALTSRSSTGRPGTASSSLSTPSSGRRTSPYR